MTSGLFLTEDQRRFQLRACFGFFFLLSLVYSLATVVAEVQYRLFGSTTQGVVVYVSSPYTADGRRITTPRVDYDYFDPAANALRQDIAWDDSNDPWPTVGQKLEIEYVPGKRLARLKSSRSNLSGFVIVPPLILGGLLALSFYLSDAKLRQDY